MVSTASTIPYKLLNKLLIFISVQLKVYFAKIEVININVVQRFPVRLNKPVTFSKGYKLPPLNKY